MLHEEVLPFKVNPINFTLVKPIETSYEVKDISKPINQTHLIEYINCLRKIYTKKEVPILDYFLKRYPVFKTDLDLISQFSENTFENFMTSYKTIEIISPLLNTQLVLNNKLPQGFSSLSGETLIKGEPRPYTHIHLLLQRDGTKLSSTYSDAEGKYKFEGVRKGESYITVAVDPLKEYTTVSQDIKA